MLLLAVTVPSLLVFVQDYHWCLQAWCSLVVYAIAILIILVVS